MEVYIWQNHRTVDVQMCHVWWHRRYRSLNHHLGGWILVLHKYCNWRSCPFMDDFLGLSSKFPFIKQVLMKTSIYRFPIIFPQFPMIFPGKPRFAMDFPMKTSISPGGSSRPRRRSNAKSNTSGVPGTCAQLGLGREKKRVDLNIDLPHMMSIWIYYYKFIYICIYVYMYIYIYIHMYI